MITDKYLFQRNWLGVIFGLCLEFAVMWGLFIEGISFFVLKCGNSSIFINSDFLAGCLLGCIVIYYGFFYNIESNPREYYK